MKRIYSRKNPIKKIRKIPTEYKCPISLCIMQNPVMASDGNTYELSSLEIYLKIMKNQLVH